MATGTVIRAAETRVERVIAPRLLTLRGAAVYLSVSTKVLRALIQGGELPFVQHIRGRSPYLLDIEDLNRWILRNKQSAGE